MNWNNFQKSLKSLFLNLLMVGLSFFVMLLLAEGVLRFLYDEVDYLKPKLVFDAKLGDKISPYSSGHDSLGFRNQTIPNNADILTLGDSQTYGVNARAFNSWPEQLQKISGRDVYNMALGGFGPLQYYHILEEEGLKLNPDFVIVGYYLGNDLLDTFTDVYVELPYWDYLKDPDYNTVHEANPRTGEWGSQTTNTSKDKLFNVSKSVQSLRIWLGSNSVLYRMIGFQISKIAYQYESDVILPARPDVSLLYYESSKPNIAFRPNYRLQAIDLEISEVLEGMRINNDLFKAINNLATQNDITLLIVLIPTKESVFAKEIREDSQLKNRDTLLKLIAAEDSVLEKTTAFFDSNNINYISALPEMQKKIDSLLLYPSNLDGHPNQFGYEVIAREVNDWINQNQNID